jgi:hypothetical protein
MPAPEWRLNRNELAKIQRLIKNEGECWIWQGPQTPNGYGKHKAGPGKTDRVIHRIVWEHYNDRKVTEKLQLDHLCRNRLCCNPAHFEEVTGSENTIRQDHANRRKTTCPNGHEYTEENTRTTPAGKRVCRECDKKRKRATELSVIGTTSSEDVASTPEQQMTPHAGGAQGVIPRGVR